MRYEQMAVAVLDRTEGLDLTIGHLPENYQRAVAAINECWDIDECAKLSNVAHAAAAYYNMANDTELEYKAKRIRLRARIRCRELLNQMPFEDQRVEALVKIGLKQGEYARLGDALKIETPKRNRLIDATPPATLNKLAKIGNPVGYQPKSTAESAPGFHSVLNFWLAISKIKPIEEAAKLDKDEAQHVKGLIRDLENWLHDFERALPGSKRPK